MRNLFLIILFTIFLPLQTNAFSENSFPDFPVAFWGQVTVDGSLAPIGSIVSAYNNEGKKLGEVVVSEAGVYGFKEPIKQKLLVEKVEGEIFFTIKHQSINGGEETKGVNIITQNITSADTTLFKDLSFVSVVSKSNPKINSGGGRGGGGGGGSVVVSNPTQEELAEDLTSSSSILVIEENSDNPELVSEEVAVIKSQLEQQLMVLLLQLVALLQAQLAALQG